MAGGAKMTVSFNKAWAKKAGKAKFVKTFEKVYPTLDVGAEYDKISPPKKDANKE